MAKKKAKGGLSRKKLQQVNKRIHLRRRLLGDDTPIVGIVQTVGRKNLKVVEVEGIGLAAHKVRVLKRLKLAKPFVVPTYKPARSIAEAMVQTSTQEVMRALGIIPLPKPTKKDIVLSPELAHTVGRLVAAHTICMAGDYVTAGKEGGGGRIGAGGIIGTIGGSGVDVEISSGGKVTTTVSPKTSTKRRSKKSSSEDASDTEVKTKRGYKRKKEKTTDDGKQIIIKQEDKTYVINFHFDIHIDANIVHQLNVNPQVVKNETAKEIPSLTEIVRQKLLEMNLKSEDEDENENKDEEENEKKKKIKKAQK